MLEQTWSKMTTDDYVCSSMTIDVFFLYLFDKCKKEGAEQIYNPTLLLTDDELDVLFDNVSFVGCDSKILGKALVFNHKSLHGDRILTRLEVEHVGKILQKGESFHNIKADYPYLTNGMLNFAALYAKLPHMVKTGKRGVDA